MPGIRSNYCFNRWWRICTNCPSVRCWSTILASCPAFAQDTSSKWDVFRHLVETLETANKRRVDILVDLDTGVPLRQPQDVSICIETMLESDVDVVITAYIPDRNPYFNMVEVDADGYAKVSKPLQTPITRRQDAPQVYGLSPAAYLLVEMPFGDMNIGLIRKWRYAWYHRKEP